MEKDKTNYLTVLRDIAFVSALYLYFIGWIYCYYYLGSFGVGIKQAGIEIYSVILYSTGVFGYYFNSVWFWIFFSILTLAIFSLYLFANKKEASSIPKFALTLVLLSLFPILFPIARNAGTRTATQDKDPTNTSLYKVYLEFKSGLLKIDTTAIGGASRYGQMIFLYNTVHNGNMYLLLSNTDTYLCLRPGRFPMIYSIKKENVEYAYIYKN